VVRARGEGLRGLGLEPSDRRAIVVSRAPCWAR